MFCFSGLLDSCFSLPSQVCALEDRPLLTTSNTFACLQTSLRFQPMGGTSRTWERRKKERSRYLFPWHPLSMVWGWQDLRLCIRVYSSCWTILSPALGLPEFGEWLPCLCPLVRGLVSLFLLLVCFIISSLLLLLTLPTLLQITILISSLQLLFLKEPSVPCYTTDWYRVVCTFYLGAVLLRVGAETLSNRWS